MSVFFYSIPCRFPLFSLCFGMLRFSVLFCPPYHFFDFLSKVTLSTAH